MLSIYSTVVYKQTPRPHKRLENTVSTTSKKFDKFRIHYLSKKNTYIN